MTEKRSAYRKQRSHSHKWWRQIKSAFSDQDEQDNPLPVNPDFKRQRQQNQAVAPKDKPLSFAEKDRQETADEKGLKLKQRLDRAILVVALLIVLVLWALFHL